MPDPFGTGFGAAGLGYRSSGRIGLTRRRQRAPETAPPDDLVDVWPTSPQMEESRTEYAAKNELPLWARILSVPSNILGREAITSGLEGVGKGWKENGIIGAIGGGIGGFLEGEWDAISHGFGLAGGMDITNFRDIRKAFGDTSTDDGIDQFAIDLLGDLATDPALWLNPLGFLGKAGQASAKAAAKGWTLQDQVVNGLRGGLVWRIPIFGQTGFDVMEGL